MSPSSSIPAREARVALAVTLLFAAALAGLAIPFYTFAGDPDHYVGLARRIAAGDSYVVNGRPEVRFPPGFPLALAPAAWLGGGSFAVIGRWSAILASLVFPLTWLYARRRTGSLGLPIALLTVCSLPFLTIATENPLSEPFYLALSLGLFLWIERRPREHPGTQWPALLLGCFLLVAVPSVRTVGIAAVAAAGIGFLSDLRTAPRRPVAVLLRDALPLIAGTVFVVAWLLWAQSNRVMTHEASRGGSYLAYLVTADPNDADLGRVTALGLLQRLLRNSITQMAHAGELLTPLPWIKPAWYSPVALLLPLLLVGWHRELRSGARFAATYFVLYLGIILLWPFDERARFLLPLAPLLWIYLVRGARWAGDRLRDGDARARVLLIVMSLLGLAGVAMAARPSSRQDLAGGGFWAVVLALALPGWNRLTALARRWTPAHGRRAAITALSLFLLGSLAQAVPLMYRRAYPPPGTRPVPGLIAAEWIREHTAPDALIQTTFPARVNFVSGRPAISFPLTRSRAIHDEVQRRYRPDYLVVLNPREGDAGPSDSVRFAILSDLLPGRWHLAHEFRGGRIYEFR